MKMAGEKLDRGLVMDALIHDRLALISMQLSGGKYKPELIGEKLFGEEEEKKRSHEVFATPEAFHTRYNSLANREERDNE